MKRLTARTKNGHAYLVNVKPGEQEVDSPHKNTLQCILDCFERLAQYEDAEEQGRLVVLPCKVGTSVFDISDGTAYETRVLNFVVGRDGVSCKTVSSWPDVSEFGTRIFLTREEVEAAMEGAEHGRD